MADVHRVNRDIILAEADREKQVRLTDLPKTDAAVKTHAIGPLLIDGIDQPHSSKEIEREKITLPPVNAREVEEAAAKAGIGEKKRMPDFALAIIKIALAREEYGTQKLKALSGQVKEQLGNIDLLLDLSSELTALPDKDSHEITDKMKGLIGKLEVQKIQIWVGDGKISKEKLSEMKAQISSQIDKLRTALQTKSVRKSSPK